jgi:hypothetical protein
MDILYPGRFVSFRLAPASHVPAQGLWLGLSFAPRALTTGGLAGSGGMRM